MAGQRLNAIFNIIGKIRAHDKKNKKKRSPNARLKTYTNYNIHDYRPIATMILYIIMTGAMS